MSNPYQILPIAILSLLLYAIGQFLIKGGIINQTLHSKIWNVILLILFFTTALLGLLLAIQVNYKLEWGFVKTALKWHVNLGIGLCLVAIFHFIWHLGYYLNLFTKTKEKRKVKLVEVEKFTGIQNLKIAVLLSGFVATVIQVLLMREIITVFAGNELMMGWVLGSWMLLTGIGAFLGKQNR